MGEVYRARDTRLDRTVALKILAGTLSSVDDRASLEREARAVAALNHPHICTLHDVSGDSETPFLVMEYVQGETLAARLARGPLPVRDTIRCAIQIGEALDHAHRHGVLHRDLKPANIMLTKAGVKVLDFGLATLRTAAPVQVPMDRTPRFDAQLTSERGLLGTVHYMAPERLEGREADVAVGSVRVRRGDVRDGDRAPRVREQQSRRRDRRHPAHRSAAGVECRARRARHARLGDSESADENARDPLAGGRRPRRDSQVDGQDGCGAGAGCRAAAIVGAGRRAPASRSSSPRRSRRPGGCGPRRSRRR